MQECLLRALHKRPENQRAALLLMALEEPIPARLRRLVEAPAPAPRPRRALAPALVLSSLVLAGLTLAIGVGWERLAALGAGASAGHTNALRNDERAGPTPPGISALAEAVFAARAADHGAAGPVGARDATPPTSSPPGSVTASAPGLAPLGVQRVSVRELRHGGYAFTEYVYRDAEDARIHLYEAGSEAPSPGLRGEGVLRLVERKGTHLVEWSVEGQRYALVADRPPAELTRLALRARASLAGPVLARDPAPVAAQVQGVSEPSPQAGPVPSTLDPVVAHPGPHDL